MQDSKKIWIKEPVMAVIWDKVRLILNAVLLVKGKQGMHSLQTSSINCNYWRWSVERQLLNIFTYLKNIELFRFHVWVGDMEALTTESTCTYET